MQLFANPPTAMPRENRKGFGLFTGKTRDSFQVQISLFEGEK
jgi:hypothetical protein